MYQYSRKTSHVYLTENELKSLDNVVDDSDKAIDLLRMAVNEQWNEGDYQMPYIFEPQITYNGNILFTEDEIVMMYEAVSEGTYRGKFDIDAYYRKIIADKGVK